MSYCRFENTCIALTECLSAINNMVENEKNSLSTSEERARKRLLNICEQFIESCEELEEMEEQNYG